MQWPGKIPPEQEIILACARMVVDSTAKSPVRALLRDGVPWGDVLANAARHRLSTVLYEIVNSCAQDLISADELNLVRESMATSRAVGLVLVGELLRLHPLLEAAKVPAIPYKGPVLAQIAYGSFIRREYSDLDYAVEQQFIPAVVSVMKSAGYRPLFAPCDVHAGQERFVPGQYCFRIDSKNLLVEFHTERTLRYYPAPLNFQDLFRRMMMVKIFGNNLRTFSIEDTIVMLCVHGAKHFWERLSWIVDIAQLITACEVNWPLLSKIAEKMESTRLLLLGLFLAHEVIGASLPQPVLERARGDTRVQWLAGKVLEQYEGNSGVSQGVWPRAVFRFRSGDGYWQGMIQLIRLSMSPTESDRQVVQLPGFLSALYSIVRPFRLLREYGVGLNRRSKPDLAVYQPTPPEIVSRMLSFAQLSGGDVLYDLGCGDGRIVVAAAEKYGIRAVGVDINPARIAEARANARRHRVENRVQFIQGDAKRADFREATVITMYLGTDANLRLADQFRAQLRPGARIVSRDFQIYGWAPDRFENDVTSKGVPTSLYLWTIKRPEQDSLPPTCAAPRMQQVSSANSPTQDAGAQGAVLQRDK